MTSRTRMTKGPMVWRPNRRFKTVPLLTDPAGDGVRQHRKQWSVHDAGPTHEHAEGHDDPLRGVVLWAAAGRKEAEAGCHPAYK